MLSFQGFLVFECTCSVDYFFPSCEKTVMLPLVESKYLYSLFPNLQENSVSCIL